MGRSRGRGAPLLAAVAMAEGGENHPAALLRAALAFAEREPWRVLGPREIFALRLPGEPHPLVASVLGLSGPERGIAFTRGDRALADMRALLSPEGAEEDFHEELSHLSMTFARYGDIPPRRRGFLRRAGFPGPGDAEAPLFLVKLPHLRPREIEDAEVRILLYALGGVLVAGDRGLLRRSAPSPGDPVPLLEVGGDPLAPDVRAAWLSAPAEGPPDPSALPGIPEDLSRLPRRPERWFAGLPVLPAEIAGEERTLRALLVAEEASGRILALHPVLGGDTGQAVEALYGAFRGAGPDPRPGLPGEIHITSRALFEALAPALAVLGVRCRFRRRIPLLARIVERLEGDLFRR